MTRLQTSVSGGPHLTDHLSIGLLAHNLSTSGGGVRVGNRRLRDSAAAALVYYHGRGGAENLIKEFKLGARARHLPCATPATKLI